MSASTAGRAGTAPQSRSRTLVGVGAGNAMEWFDWNVYATFAAFFASQFFASGDAASDFLSALAVFAVGFLARPFGGFLFGWLADRRGRQLSMSISVGAAAVGSLVIGLTPTYATIGILAPIILVLARLAQGLAHGGELPAAQTYISEMAPRERRGLWSSLIYVSGTIGIVAATVLGAVLAAVLTEAQMSSFGWRIPFLLGGVFGLYALYMRTRMRETPTYTEAASTAVAGPVARRPLWREILDHPVLLLRVLGLTMGATVLYYVWAVAAPAFAISNRGIDPAGALWAGAAANLVFLIALPLWGALSDRVGRKPVLLTSAGLLAVLLVPLNAFIQGEAWRLFLAMSVALLLLAAPASIGPAVYAEMFPTGIRAAGFGVPYSVAVALFGGTAPYLQAFFADRGASGVFTAYAITLAAISVLVVVFMPETRGRHLGENRPAGAAPRAH
ncbi:MFS transporter [Geodermatophilus sp. DF01-2]|uniref:MFS transporter n=1 Tax=Geodermatophilus sp. DF01-2 TaxID=2559610 RepID=UPI0010744F05|nr:MFS transporter [Geodermatophilus sp. DF01_2]TFV61830.1 MFS transporter [Geodermatophilus sp. DF01_2]